MAAPSVNLRERKSKKKTTYFLDFAVNGKRFRKSVGTNKKVAQEILLQKQLELSRGYFNMPTLPNTNNISLEDLIKAFLASKRNHLRPSSLKRYQNYLDKFNDYMKKFFPGPSQSVRDIRINYIEESFNYFLENEITNKKHWESKTVNGLRSILFQLFNYGIKQHFLNSNPAKETKSFPKKPKNKVEYYSDEELKNIWETLDEFWVEPLKFIVHTGLRKGEWINLKWTNVNLEGSSPYISIVSSGEWITKTGEARAVPLNKVALEIIKNQKGKNATYVFTSKSGAKIHPDKPYHSLKTALKKLGLTGDIHKLRHTFASKLAMKGVPLFDIQRLLGHSDSKTTMIYAHLSPGHLQESVKKLE